jgi:regulator of cell morphogenesis and NO signaling
MKKRTVGELAIEIPGATRLFEGLGIDYCCGGNQTLEEACQAAGVALEEVRDSLDIARFTAAAERKDRDWQTEPLSELIEHIKKSHHKFIQGEAARLGPLFDKVCAVHGENHPELERLRAIFDELVEELATHLMKEEAVLFPYIVRLEEAAIEKAPVVPPPFGNVRNPVAMMIEEHADAGADLHELRRESSDYSAPPDACITYRTLYAALADFELDLHQHIHLENNVLFPRAIAMEQACLEGQLCRHR